MKSIFISLLAFFLQDPQSQIVIKVSDYQGKKAKAKIEIYQDEQLILSKYTHTKYQAQLPKGRYKIKVMACDTIVAPIRVWNKEHEYQISVDTNCKSKL